LTKTFIISFVSSHLDSENDTKTINKMKDCAQLSNLSSLLQSLLFAPQPTWAGQRLFGAGAMIFILLFVAYL